MTPIAFRAARPGDAERIVGLIDGVAAPTDLQADLGSDIEADSCIGVGELDGQIVAAGRLGVIGSREGWVDWLRVHPDHRQQNVGQGLTGFLVDAAIRMELRVVRAGWPAENIRAHRAAARLGFHRVAGFAPFAGESLSGASPVLCELTERDYSAVQNRLGLSSLSKACAGLFARQNRWQELTSRQIRELLSLGLVLGLRGAEGRLDAFVIADVSAPGWKDTSAITVGYLDGDVFSLERLAYALRGLAQACRGGMCSVVLPDDPTVRGVFQSAGFRDVMEGKDTWIFERYLSTSV